MQLSAMLLLAAPLCAAALQLQPGAYKPQPVALRSRTTGVTMGDTSTKKWNEWKYVKGINDYGKEQTYMYLGAKKDAADDSAPLSAPLLDLGEWSFFVKPYYIILFTPLLLAGAYIVSGAKF